MQSRLQLSTTRGQEIAEARFYCERWCSMQINSRTNISLRVKQNFSVLVSVGMAGCMQPIRLKLERVAAASGLASILWVLEMASPGGHTL
jgi:hypothetical protein